MRRANLHILLALALLIALGACRRSAGTAPEADLPPVLLQVSVDQPSITVGDLIRYTIEVNHATNVMVAMPEFAENLGGFAISDWLNPPPSTADGRVRRTQTYVMETYLTGEYEIPPAEAVYIFAGHTNTVASTPICVDVHTVAEEDDLFSGIRDIKGPVAIAAVVPTNWPMVIGIAATAAALCIALTWALVRYLRRPTPPPPPLPAHVIAYAALRALSERNLVEAGRIKEYFYTLSTILRQYIEDRFGLHAPERTTEEFLAEIRHGDQLSVAQRSVLAEFLRQSDLVKFANYAASGAEASAAHDVAVRFIEETRVRADAAPTPAD
jgi:hypothetical protein